MAPAEPLQVAQQVATALERCRVRYLVGGSLASSVTGEPRSTLDVDLVVALTQADVAPFLANLGDGFHADEETLRSVEENGQVAFRYCTSNGEITPDANPNGSLNNIAGVTNSEGNVLGMMPHPERACETLVGGTDGATLFQSLVHGFLAR
jgi:phosphoribosylformylglycinamidine (FGAM) synthase-like amidotransferase family enzyme